jgi:hypothetical protein
MRKRSTPECTVRSKAAQGVADFTVECERRAKLIRRTPWVS